MKGKITDTITLQTLKPYIGAVEYRFVDLSEHKNLAVFFVVDKVNEKLIKAITMDEYDKIVANENFAQEDMATIKTDKIIEQIKEYIVNNIFKTNK